MKKHYSLVSTDLSQQIISHMLRCTILEAEYSELVIDLIHFFDKDVATVIDGKFSQLYDYSTKAIKSLSKPLHTEGNALRMTGGMVAPSP